VLREGLLVRCHIISLCVENDDPSGCCALVDGSYQGRATGAYLHRTGSSSAQQQQFGRRVGVSHPAELKSLLGALST